MESRCRASDSARGLRDGVNVRGQRAWQGPPVAEDSHAGEFMHGRPLGLDHEPRGAQAQVKSTGGRVRVRSPSRTWSCWKRPVGDDTGRQESGSELAWKVLLRFGAEQRRGAAENKTRDSQTRENTSNRSRREFWVPKETQICILEEAVSADVSGQGCSYGF